MLRRGPLKPVVLVHTDIHPMAHVKTLGKHVVLVGDGAGVAGPALATARPSRKVAATAQPSRTITNTNLIILASEIGMPG